MKTKSARSHAIGLRLLALGAVALSSCVGPEGEQPGAKTGGAAGSVELPKGGNLIKMSGFDGKTFLPWTSSFSQPGEGDAFLENGWFCTKVRNPGTNKWDAQMRHREMTIYKNHKYTLQFPRAGAAEGHADAAPRERAGQASERCDVGERTEPRGREAPE